MNGLDAVQSGLIDADLLLPSTFTPKPATTTADAPATSGGVVSPFGARTSSLIDDQPISPTAPSSNSNSLSGPILTPTLIHAAAANNNRPSIETQSLFTLDDSESSPIGNNALASSPTDADTSSMSLLDTTDPLMSPSTGAESLLIMPLTTTTTPAGITMEAIPPKPYNYEGEVDGVAVSMSSAEVGEKLNRLKRYENKYPGLYAAF
jgi:hypothetical protein